MDHVPRKDRNATAVMDYGKLASRSPIDCCQLPIYILIRISTLTTAMEFLTYAPQARNRKTNNHNYLDQLGFEKGSEAAEDEAFLTRAAFVKDLRNHVKSSDFEYLLKVDNEQAFEMMIKGFLLKYGTTYWGASKRSHLVEKDPAKGFLCPRDAERKDSRYWSDSTIVLARCTELEYRMIEVLELMFNYRAHHARYADVRLI